MGRFIRRLAIYSAARTLPAEKERQLTGSELIKELMKFPNMDLHVIVSNPNDSDHDDRYVVMACERAPGIHVGGSVRPLFDSEKRSYICLVVGDEVTP